MWKLCAVPSCQVEICAVAARHPREPSAPHARGLAAAMGVFKLTTFVSNANVSPTRLLDGFEGVPAPTSEPRAGVSAEAGTQPPATCTAATGCHRSTAPGGDSAGGGQRKANGTAAPNAAAGIPVLLLDAPAFVHHIAEVVQRGSLRPGASTLLLHHLPLERAGRVDEVAASPRVRARVCRCDITRQRRGAPRVTATRRELLRPAPRCYQLRACRAM